MIKFPRVSFSASINNNLEFIKDQMTPLFYFVFVLDTSSTKSYLYLDARGRIFPISFLDGFGNIVIQRDMEWTH